MNLSKLGEYYGEECAYCPLKLVEWCKSFNNQLMRLFLTHLPLVLHICVAQVGRHWFEW